MSFQPNHEDWSDHQGSPLGWSWDHPLYILCRNERNPNPWFEHCLRNITNLNMKESEWFYMVIPPKQNHHWGDPGITTICMNWWSLAEDWIGSLDVGRLHTTRTRSRSGSSSPVSSAVRHPPAESDNCDAQHRDSWASTWPVSDVPQPAIPLHSKKHSLFSCDLRQSSVTPIFPYWPTMSTQEMPTQSFDIHIIENVNSSLGQRWPQTKLSWFGLV